MQLRANVVAEISSEHQPHTSNCVEKMPMHIKKNNPKTSCTYQLQRYGKITKIAERMAGIRFINCCCYNWCSRCYCSYCSIISIISNKNRRASVCVKWIMFHRPFHAPLFCSPCHFHRDDFHCCCWRWSWNSSCNCCVIPILHQQTALNIDHDQEIWTRRKAWYVHKWEGKSQ